MIFADLIRPANKSFAFTYDLLCILAGTLFLALTAQISFPLWFTPVPLTLQSFAVFLIGAFLGPKRGVAALLTYFTEGFWGLPVFASGTFGVAKFLGPTGGYLLGFVLAVLIMGRLLERKKKERFTDILLVFSIGAVIILGMGAFWLSWFVGVKNALQMGVYPFLLGDLLKVSAAASLTYSFKKMIPTSL